MRTTHIVYKLSILQNNSEEEQNPMGYLNIIQLIFQRPKPGRAI